MCEPDKIDFEKRLEHEEELVYADLELVEKREPYYHDRDRILHSRAFRRLMHKTQIFNANKGDHYRNRLTHTLEVAQIARSIGKFFSLHDALIEAISYGHDLGHTPFGHIGEKTLNKILEGKYCEKLTNENAKLFPMGPEKFKHNFQSLRVVDSLECRIEEKVGLNLTFAVREGILKHTNKLLEINYSDLNLEHMQLSHDFSCTLEGQIVAIADEIAQCTHDLEDGVRSGILSIMDVENEDLIKLVIEKMQLKNLNYNSKTPCFDVRINRIKFLVGYLINDVCRQSRENLGNLPINKKGATFAPKKIIDFSPEIKKLVQNLSEYIRKSVICSEEISIADAKAEKIIVQLFLAYYQHPKQLPDYILTRYYLPKGLEFNRLKLKEEELKQDIRFVRLICDHLAGMTDQFASREFLRLFYPDYV